DDDDKVVRWIIKSAAKALESAKNEQKYSKVGPINLDQQRAVGGDIGQEDQREYDVLLDHPQPGLSLFEPHVFGRLLHLKLLVFLRLEDRVRKTKPGQLL